MAVNDIFRKVPIEVPNKSGFDMSHEHNFTAKVGTLVPAMVDMVLPNDSISLSVSSEIQLPPMATDFYGRVRGCYEAFFVPCRILYGGWQDFMTHPVNGAVYPSGTTTGNKSKFLPTLRIACSNMGPGSLSDYLGYGFEGIQSGTVDVLNPLKYVAYHKIWDDFYRDSRIQSPAFSRDYYINNQNGEAITEFARLPYRTDYFASVNPTPYVIDHGSAYPNGLYDDMCQDGTYMYNLRQRNFGRDYFTNASPLPQAGQPASVAFGVSNNQGAFTIQSLRAANSLEMWLERNNVAGYRYGDQIRAHFGVYPSDAALDRPLYLGRQSVDVYNKSVFENDGSTTSSNTQNPFSSVGAKYGSPLGVGSGKLVDNFTASEHGFIFVMFSLVPDSIYSDILSRDFFYNQVSDFPFPLLQGIGDQEISLAELCGYKVGDPLYSTLTPQADLNLLKSTVFGYTQRYADFKFKLDRVSGLLKDDQSLASFALQRSFDAGSSAPSLGSSFIEIPTNFLDGVSAVNGDVSQYGCWCENHFNYHKVSTLAAYSIPTLGEPKNTHTEVISNGGFRL